MDTMNVLLISEAESRTELSDDLQARIVAMARAKQCGVEAVTLHRNDVPPCTGCFTCILNHPGRCAYARSFAPSLLRIIDHAPDLHAVVFLAPARYGTFSSTMKNIVEKGGFVIQYRKGCRQIIIGFGEDATNEERDTFIDITAKHRGKADVVHPDLMEECAVYFTRSRHDSGGICKSLEGILERGTA
jgi:multimeric flavodoxin WrbA